MKIPNKISLILFALGLAVIIVSTKQWLFDFPDKSQLYFGLTTGVFCILFGLGWHLHIKVIKEQLRLDGMLKLLWKGDEDWEK